MAEEARLRREMRMVIRKARERRAMSQADFAVALGDLLGRRVTASQVSDWERGRFPPSGEVLLAAAEVAGGSMDALRDEAGTIGERIEELEDEVATLRDRLDGEEAVGSFADQLAEVKRSVGILQAQMLHLQEEGEGEAPSDEVIRTAQAR